SQSDRAQAEALSALSYATDPIKSGTHFGTATSLDEWIHIIARANSDTATMIQAGTRYADTVDRNVSENSWTDPTGHYPVTALAFRAENAYLNETASKHSIFLTVPPHSLTDNYRLALMSTSMMSEVVLGRMMAIFQVLLQMLTLCSRLTNASLGFMLETFSLKLKC
ncbi:MAG: hypothetical protein K2G77_01175, partial [Muribaculaceae bacterium]|nr:hypothetical protein [Muribaculaceae bacterium]